MCVFPSPVPPSNGTTTGTTGSTTESPTTGTTGSTSESPTTGATGTTGTTDATSASTAATTDAATASTTASTTGVDNTTGPTARSDFHLVFSFVMDDTNTTTNNNNKIANYDAPDCSSVITNYVSDRLYVAGVAGVVIGVIEVCFFPAFLFVLICFQFVCMLFSLFLIVRLCRNPSARSYD